MLRLSKVLTNPASCREISLIDCGEGFTDIGFCVLVASLLSLPERGMISLEISFCTSITERSSIGV